MNAPRDVRTDVVCERMTPNALAQAKQLLSTFLEGDPHYRESAARYGDGGAEALDRALALFLARPEIGFVWLARVDGEVVAACVVCYAISTSRGMLVAKLDDVTVNPRYHGRGIGTAMLDALAARLATDGIGRIDTACHRDNDGAWRFYAARGFRPLGEERLALLL
ncbi:MAG TPA: GNAT family N-acetyltransferase [Casimicrobiaceae bacterium]|nr:GNAT family N-acetyltransferase [Casimicrobiaceae bacterium]